MFSGIDASDTQSVHTLRCYTIKIAFCYESPLNCVVAYDELFAIRKILRTPVRNTTLWSALLSHAFVNSIRADFRHLREMRPNLFLGINTRPIAEAPGDQVVRIGLQHVVVEIE